MAAQKLLRKIRNSQQLFAGRARKAPEKLWQKAWLGALPVSTAGMKGLGPTDRFGREDFSKSLTRLTDLARQYRGGGEIAPSEAEEAAELLQAVSRSIGRQLSESRWDAQIREALGRLETPREVVALDFLVQPGQEGGDIAWVWLVARDREALLALVPNFFQWDDRVTELLREAGVPLEAYLSGRSVRDYRA